MTGPGGNRVQYMGNREAMDKKSEALKKFSGSPGDFTNWANRFMDHMGRVHGDWKNTLQWLAETEENLSYARLSNEVLGPWNEGACNLARQLEQTIIDYMPEKIYHRRQQLCGGPLQKENGFILWRNLFREHVGEKQILEDAGVECLRTYGQCSTLADLSAHIDGWYELLDGHCPEMRECPRMLRSLFLNIIPKDLKSKILEEPKLQLSDHRALAEWCKGRALILQREHLADVARKNMSKTYGGSVKSLTEIADGQTPQEPPPWLNTLIAAIKPPPPSSIAAAQRAERGRPSRKDDKDKRSSSRSSSRGRRFLEGWGKRCNHCGATDHIKKDCKEFETMMRKANVGKEKKDWKPPSGYKSALGKARDAARDAEQKKKKVAALENGDDTASDDDDDCDFSSQHGESFKIKALTRIPRNRSAPEPPKMCSVNKFEGLDEQQEYDPEVLAALNTWAHNVRVAPKRDRKVKQSPTHQSKLDRTVNYINSHKKPNIKNRTDKEIDVIVNQIAAATRSSKASHARAARRIGSWELEDGEIVAIVDTGSFTHAIDADVELPDHNVDLCDPDAPGSSAETAGGDVIKKLGIVHTKGIIDGNAVEITWDHMKVSTPILSVRKLVKDGNDVYINRKGGYIENLITGKRLKIFNFQGIYYLRMKVTSGSSPSPEHRPDFHRPGP